MKPKLFIIGLILILGCKDGFIPGTNSYEPLMVVDGTISDQPGPYAVKITKSSAIGSKEMIPYEDCTVIIYENTGKSETLIEDEPGIYLTSKDGIQGIIGNEYKIYIYTPEGNEYESEFQELKAPVEIEAVHADSSYLEDIEYPLGLLPGYQFYIDTKTANSQEEYFVWRMIETYEYDIDYNLAYVETRSGVKIYNPVKYDTLRTCWNTQQVKYVFTGTTSKLSIPKITNQPLHFVGTDTKKLSIRYTVLINQLVVNKVAYNFWNKIEEQNSDANFMVSKQPYTIRGNIENVNNPNEIILGYFTVAAITQKRIFVDKPEKPFYFVKCIARTDPIAIGEFKKRNPSPYFWVALGGDQAGLVDKSCIDCRNEGGSLSKPDFWID